MGNSWDELTYIINCLDARKQQSCYQNHIPTVMCNICSSSFHISDACPILLDTAFCGETQFVGNFQGQYYQEQNSYLAEQPIWSHPQFQQFDSLVVEPQLSLEELIKQMDENHKQRAEQIQSSLQCLAVQVEQIVSTAHQLQEKKMFHDDVQPVALLEVMQCDTSLDETPGEPIESILVSIDEQKINNLNSNECMKEITPQNFLKSDLDELYTSLEVDKSLEIFSCECGVCNVCHEISAAILGEHILMPPTTCAEIQENPIVVEFYTKHVDFNHKQSLPIAEKVFVEHLIKPRHLQLPFAICASLPPILSESQANSELCDFHVFVIAGLPYVHALPPKPPDFSLISKFTCYLLFPIPRVRSLERPPRKPPDVKDTIPP
ncbi:hypothetical protein QL285_014860 [Trifolium repens]|nr:hypothetical protein QL285_014860 [Trifolium repens]